MFMCMIIYYLVWITLLEWSPPIILLFFIPTTSREMDSVVFNFPFKRSNPTLANLLLVYYVFYVRCYYYNLVCETV